MTIRRAKSSWLAMTLGCISIVGGCAQDKKYEGISVRLGSKGDKAPYIYDATGPLDFDGQDPVTKANKVMLAACPLGQPTLVMVDAPRFQTDSGNRRLLIAFFTCNQPIPGVK